MSRLAECQCQSQKVVVALSKVPAPFSKDFTCCCSFEKRAKVNGTRGWIKSLFVDCRFKLPILFLQQRQHKGQVAEITGLTEVVILFLTQCFG